MENQLFSPQKKTACQPVLAESLSLSLGDYKNVNTCRQCMSLMEKTEFFFFWIPYFRALPVGPKLWRPFHTEICCFAALLWPACALKKTTHFRKRAQSIFPRCPISAEQMQRTLANAASTTGLFYPKVTPWKLDYVPNTKVPTKSQRHHNSKESAGNNIWIKRGRL